MFKYTARYSFIIFKVSIIPPPRGLAVLFLGIVLASTPTVHAMSMAPMPMRPEEPLCRMAERKRTDEKVRRKVLREYENKLIDDLLTSCADLNTFIGPGGKPLEIVSRAKAIATLLQHGADPMQCQRSPLLHSLLYYISHVDNKEVSDFSLDYSIYQQEKMRRDSLRRAIKLFECFKLLLRAGANANQERQGRLPLQTLLRLERDGYCSCINIDSLLKLLIWHGANPGNIERWSARNAYGYRMGINGLDRLNMKQERQKYEAVCQLLKGNKEGNSPLSFLPKPILKKIINYIKYGPFVPPAEKKAISPKVEVAASASMDRAPSEEVLIANVSQPSKPDCMWGTRWKHMIGKKLLVVTAASGLGWWAYKKWKQRREEQEKRRQELWNEYYRNRVVY